MQEGLQYYKMENGQKEVSQLFDGRKIFCIPSYQRSYSWEEKQLKEFLEDLDNQLSDKNYFFGTILFQEDEREDDFSHSDWPNLSSWKLWDDRVIYQGGYHLVKPIIDEFGKEGMVYLMQNSPTKDDLLSLEDYQNKVMKKLYELREKKPTL